MKNTALIFLGITTLILILVTVLSALNIQFPVVFYLTCLGQALLIFTVYKVLTDDYQTDKNFEDWYEDYPVGKEEK